MSVVAVKVSPTRVTIAADSIITKGDLKRTNFKKLHRFENIVVAGCGSAEELSLFFEFVRCNIPESADVEGIQNYLCKFADMRETCLGERKPENEYILVYRGHVFEVDCMFVHEIEEGFTAIGEGEPYALTALHLGHDVVTAVKVACQLSCYAHEPVVKEVIERWEHLK